MLTRLECFWYTDHNKNLIFHSQKFYFGKCLLPAMWLTVRTFDWVCGEYINIFGQTIFLNIWLNAFELELELERTPTWLLRRLYGLNWEKRSFLMFPLLVAGDNHDRWSLWCPRGENTLESQLGTLEPMYEDRSPVQAAAYKRELQVLCQIISQNTPYFTSSRTNTIHLFQIKVWLVWFEFNATMVL